MVGKAPAIESMRRADRQAASAPGETTTRANRRASLFTQALQPDRAIAFMEPTGGGCLPRRSDRRLGVNPDRSQSNSPDSAHTRTGFRVGTQPALTANVLVQRTNNVPFPTRQCNRP